MKPSKKANILSPIVALGSLETLKKLTIPSNIPKIPCIIRAATQPRTGIPASVPAHAPLSPIFATIPTPIFLNRPPKSLNGAVINLLKKPKKRVK